MGLSLPLQPPSMPRILLLQNDPVVGERMRSVITAMPGLEVTGLTNTLAQAIRSVQMAPPDLLLADLHLSSTEFVSLLAELCGHAREGRPQVLVVALTLDDPALMEAIGHGADGYFIHGGSTEALRAAIQQVLAGESPMAPPIARRVKAHFGSPAWNGRGFGVPTRDALRLTDAQVRMLDRICDGYLVHEIARAMQTTPHDVGLGIRTLYRKLQFDLRAAAMAKQSV
jgi:DNA-binding NarL/FixJ family response regulator